MGLVILGQAPSEPHRAFRGCTSPFNFTLPTDIQLELQLQLQLFFVLNLSRYADARQLHAVSLLAGSSPAARQPTNAAISAPCQIR